VTTSSLAGIRPLLPPPAAGPIVDLGCGNGAFVRLLQADGFDAEGSDISPEQAALAGAAGVRQGDFRALLAVHPAHYATVTATDLLERLTKREALQAFDDVAAALRPGGVFVGRVPDAVSPLGGHIRPGDFTHQTSFTARSIRQLAAPAGFGEVVARSCPPAGHGLPSAARVVVWQDPTPAGNQPFVSADRRGTCVFNGGIYNRRQLAKRCRLTLRTACGGEVIPQLWAKLGPDSLAELREMFAIALADALADRLSTWPVIRSGSSLSTGACCRTAASSSHLPAGVWPPGSPVSSPNGPT
jgi:hypothetical protein